MPPDWNNTARFFISDMTDKNGMDSIPCSLVSCEKASSIRVGNNAGFCNEISMAFDSSRFDGCLEKNESLRTRGYVENYCRKSCDDRCKS